MEALFIHGVGRKYHSRIPDLFIVVAPMSTLPFGGYHGLLLGCGINNINPLHLWSYHGSTLLALAYPCVNRAYRSSLVCRHWHGHPGLVAVLHRVLHSINPFQYVNLISGLSSCENQPLVADCRALFISRWRNGHWSYIIDLGLWPTVFRCAHYFWPSVQLW